MNICSILNDSNLWSGFFGTIIGAIVGGYIAYLIAKLHLRKQERQRAVDEKVSRNEKEIQLLWQIYFDIKTDCENAKLWDKYDELLHKREDMAGTPSAEYIEQIVNIIMRDIKNLLLILSAKEKEHEKETYNELDLLWLRVGQLLSFMYELFKKSSQFAGNRNIETLSYYEKANEFYQIHINKFKK